MQESELYINVKTMIKFYVVQIYCGTVLNYTHLNTKKWAVNLPVFIYRTALYSQNSSVNKCRKVIVLNTSDVNSVQ